MKTSPAGVALIKEFERCVLKAYKDGGGVWTIGWGHTGPKVIEGIVWNQIMADATLLEDLRDAEDVVNKSVTAHLTQNEFDACVSLAYNIGGKFFKNSTLVKFLNEANYDAAAAQFKRWNHDNHVEVAGLTRRREAERVLFERTS